MAHSACGADERGTQPLYEHVSHSNPRESVLFFFFDLDSVKQFLDLVLEFFLGLAVSLAEFPYLLV